MPQYKIYNGPAPTTAAQLAVTTGTAIETTIQVKMLAAIQIKVKAWGVSMDGAAAAAGVQWELLETGTVFATVTAHVASGVLGWDAQGMNIASGTYFDFGTVDTGFTSTGEGTIVASRVFDSQFVQPTGQYAWEFSLGNEPSDGSVEQRALATRGGSAPSTSATGLAVCPLSALIVSATTLFTPIISKHILSDAVDESVME